MHPYTKHTLADALKDMLGTKTLDKIRLGGSLQVESPNLLLSFSGYL